MIEYVTDPRYNLQMTGQPIDLMIRGANEWVLEMNFDPPQITINPDITWDEAARKFWNTMAKMAGQPEPFPDAGSAAHANA